MLAANRILIWEFSSAPSDLRRLHEGPAARWITLVPRALFAEDVDVLLREQGNSSAVYRYETDAGDVVYAGSGSLVDAMTALSSAEGLSGHPC